MRRAVAVSALLVVVACTGCVDLLDQSVAPETPAPTPTITATPTPPAAIVVATDSGAVEHAMGTATPTADGAYEYVVTSGDTPSAIGFRFGVCTLDVILSNPQQDPWPLADQTIVVSRVTDIPLGTHDCRFDVDQHGWR